MKSILGSAKATAREALDKPIANPMDLVKTWMLSVASSMQVIRINLSDQCCDMSLSQPNHMG